MTERKGTVLMECVLVMPLLLMLIFSIVQFALIWYAQIMTHYAAYNAARAALVYHPGEYRQKDAKANTTDEFLERKGPCWEAACRTLAWVSSSPAWDSDGMGGVGRTLRVPGWWDGRPIPYSAHIANQVRLRKEECSEGLGTNAPVVKVTVEFDFPLHVPVVGRMLAYLDKVDDTAPSRYDLWGWTPDAAGAAQLEAHRHSTMKTDFITLTAVALMPKLWDTSFFARAREYDEE